MAAARSLLLRVLGVSFFITRFVDRAAVLEEAAGCSLSVFCAQACSKLQRFDGVGRCNSYDCASYQYARVDGLLCCTQRLELQPEAKSARDAWLASDWSRRRSGQVQEPARPRSQANHSSVSHTASLLISRQSIF